MWHISHDTYIGNLIKHFKQGQIHVSCRYHALHKIPYLKSIIKPALYNYRYIWYADRYLSIHRIERSISVDISDTQIDICRYIGYTDRYLSIHRIHRSISVDTSDTQIDICRYIGYTDRYLSIHRIHRSISVDTSDTQIEVCRYIGYTDRYLDNEIRRAGKQTGMAL